MTLFFSEDSGCRDVERNALQCAFQTSGDSILALQNVKCIFLAQYLHALLIYTEVGKPVVVTKSSYSGFHVQGENDILKAEHLLIFQILIHDQMGGCLLGNMQMGERKNHTAESSLER